MVEYYKHNKIQDVKIWLDKAVEIRSELALQLCKTFFILAKNDYPKLATFYGEKAVLLGADTNFKKVVETRQRWLKNSKTIEQDLKSQVIKLKDAQDVLDELLEKSLEEALSYISTIELYDNNIVLPLKEYYLKCINKTHALESVKMGISIIEQLDNKPLLKVLAARAYGLRDYVAALAFYKKYYALTQDNSIVDRLLTCISQNIDIDEVSLDNYQDILSSSMADYISFSSSDISLFQYKLAFYILKRAGFDEEAIHNGIKVVEIEPNEQISLELAKTIFNLGDISKAVTQSRLNKSNDKHDILINIYNSYLKLKEKGFVLPAKEDESINVKDNVLYVLNNSLPYHSNGYATRAHGLLQGIKKFTTPVHAITRLGYPHDLVKFKNSERINKHVIDSISYYHLPSHIGLNHIPLDNYLKEYGEQLANHAKKYNIGVIHSASNFVNGLAANYAAKKLGLKSIYEVRGLWEITRISRQPKWQNSEHFEMIKKLETEAALHADQVLTITQALKDELIRRGVDSNKIEVLPNGVNSKVFSPMEKK